MSINGSQNSDSKKGRDRFGLFNSIFLKNASSYTMISADMIDDAGRFLKLAIDPPSHLQVPIGHVISVRNQELDVNGLVFGTKYGNVVVNEIHTSDNDILLAVSVSESLPQYVRGSFNFQIVKNEELQKLVSVLELMLNESQVPVAVVNTDTTQITDEEESDLDRAIRIFEETGKATGVRVASKSLSNRLDDVVVVPVKQMYKTAKGYVNSVLA